MIGVVYYRRRRSIAAMVVSSCHHGRHTLVGPYPHAPFIVVIMPPNANTARICQQADCRPHPAGVTLCILCQTTQRPLQPSGSDARPRPPDHCARCGSVGACKPVGTRRRISDRVPAPLHTRHQRMHRPMSCRPRRYLCVGQIRRKKGGWCKADGA